jgi:large subunit ribosomal protein L10
VPFTREKKSELIAEYTEKLSRSQATYLTHYRGLTVTEISDLRTKLRESGEAEYLVTKNTLLGIALRQAGMPVPENLLEGPTAVVFCYKDPVAPAKTLSKYVDTSEKVTLRGGILGPSILSPADVKGMADLPSREVLLATLLGSIQGPASSIVSTIMAPMREIAYILAQRGEGASNANAGGEAAA